MKFIPLDHNEWPCGALREFVAVLDGPAATPSLLSEMGPDLLGTATPPTFKDFADILVAAGLFASKGQANKAGAKETEVPPGLSVFKIGKLKTFVWIWNPIEDKVSFEN